MHIFLEWLLIFFCKKNQMEKAEQDDGLSDLSNILGDLKGMASEMGSQLDRCGVFFCIKNLNFIFCLFVCC